MSSNSNIDFMVGNRPLSSLRVVDLKQELEKRGLSKSGSKKDLVDRLRLRLQIEKHRDTGASADEEELPNYSQVHDELADQNPFIRDYLASQAELFHSQKVVKKLVEEEAKRESETSADEGVESPMKQPPSLEKEQSPVTETRRQSRRRIDSQKDDMTAEKLVTRSSRSKSNERKEDRKSKGEDEKKVEPEENGEQIKSQEESPVIEAPLKTRRSKSRSASRSPIRGKSADKAAIPETSHEEPAPKEEPEAKLNILPTSVDKNEESDESSKPRATEKLDTGLLSGGENGTPISGDVVKNTEVTQTKEVPVADVPEKVEKSRSVSRSPVRDKSEERESPEAVCEEPKPKDESVAEKEIAPVGKPDLEDDSSSKDEVDHEDESSSKDDPGPEDDSSSKDIPSPKNDEPCPEDDSSSKDIPSPKDKPSPKHDAEVIESETKSANIIEDKKDTDDTSSPRSVGSKEDSRSRGEDEKTSGPEENDEESHGEESPITETSSKTHRSRSSSASRSPVREKSPEKETKEAHAKDTISKDESEDKSEAKSAQEEEKMDVDDSASPRYKSSQKETSYSNNDIAGEEALDYGEEEEDEDRNESDPQEFSWARRSLRFKNKCTFVAPTCKWKLEEESKHLVVKSELLNSYYEDIKLVPLEQLKLEEKSSDAAATETKKEVERKPSISKEAEPEPLPTRTVENVVAPTIKRTVSIIPTTKAPADVSEEVDKALTPPRNPPSDVLLITNLVRPFTLIQLKEMLQRTGNLQDIWVDKIKSKCIAKFASQEEAFETRAALHGVCWPNSNPKSLQVDYTTQDNLDEHKAKEGAEQTTVTEKPVSAQPVPVREWDVGKKAEPKSPGRNRKRSRSRSTSRDRTKRSRRSSSPGRRRRSKSPAHERRSRGGEGKEPEPMGKALDELFRKTIATPSIYWLPLTPEQIAEKEELRRKRMLERERRLAELNKMRPR